MTQSKAFTQSSIGTSTLAPRLSTGFSAAFLLLLFVLHFLEPEFDPSWRMISEYAIGGYGWLMRLAFFCWGGSVLTLLAAIWPDLRTLSGKIARGWLVVIVAALFGAGIFVTQPITEPATTTAHVLHSVCGVIVIMTFPIAASLAARSLSQHPDWTPVKGRLLWLTMLVWLSMFAFFGSIIVSNMFNPDAGRNGPEVYIGWPNRIMVIVYHLWLIGVSWHAAQTRSA
jgi:hypothetical protein